MHNFKSSCLHEAQERGFINQCTNLQKLDELMHAQKIIAYVGFDPTAASLHVGNLTLIMLARLLQKHGHRIVILLGDATASIGDPSGKDAMRKMLDWDKIQQHSSQISLIFEKYIDFNIQDSAAITVNNKEWLAKIDYLEFLHDYGQCFSINRMLNFDSVKSRLDKEQHLSFLEFNYMILQAYDFLKLYQEFKCVLQLGGSDQWGNIINGIDLIKRITGQEVFGLTAPLLTMANGQKMGKSVNGAIWLDANMLDPFDYWQFWRNSADADVNKFLKIYTDLSIDEINKLAQLKGQDINHAKIVLADEATKLCHGPKAIYEAHQAAKAFFAKQNNNSPNIKDLKHTCLSFSLLEKNFSIIDALIKAKLVNSKGEAKRLISGNGVRVNDNLISDINYCLTTQDLEQQIYLKISTGKKNHVVLKFEQ